MSTEEAVLAVIVMAAVTLILRAAPFVLFPAGKKTPDFIKYLGKVLPYAIMGMLVVYCYRRVDFTGTSHGIPELLAGIAVVLLHCWRRNTLLSIAGGTVLYMVLIQMVF